MKIIIKFFYFILESYDIKLAGCSLQ